MPLTQKDIIGREEGNRDSTVLQRRLLHSHRKLDELKAADASFAPAAIEEFVVLRHHSGLGKPTGFYFQGNAANSSFAVS